MKRPERSLLLSVVALLVTGTATARAQAPIVPCEPSPQVVKALRTVPSSSQRDARVAALRGLLQRFPSDVYLHQRYQDTARYPAPADRDAVIAEYRALAGKHPKDAGYRFLAARAQVGVATKQVIPELEGLVASVPRAHLTLVQIYQAPVFRDATKARQHLEAFVKTCPSSLAAYQYFDSLEPSDFVTQSTAHLRTILQQRSDPESIASWSTLWSLEFRLRPVAEHDVLRRQVGTDLKRLRTMRPSKDTGTYYGVLQEGYKLTGDTEGEKLVIEEARKADPASAVWAVRDQWYKEHPYPKPEDPPEKRAAYNQALAKVSAEWTREWPDNVGVWFTRVGALRETVGDATAAEVEAAGERLLKMAALHPGDMYFMSPTGGSSFALFVADLYARKGVRIERLPELVAQGLKELGAPRGVGWPSDLYPPRNEDSSREYNEWYGALTIADIWLNVKDKERAREALTRVHAASLKSKPKADVKDGAQAARQRATYLERQGDYWRRMGDLARLEGRKADAMSYYQNALLARAQAPGPNAKDELAEKAKSLWKDLGGTNEGWIVWSDRKELFAQPGDAPAASRWTKIEKTLPNFTLTDATGKAWDLAALKGKITMINVWAST